MAKKRTSVDRLALQTAQTTQAQSASMSSRLRALRDGTSGLTNDISAPTIATKRHTIKSSSSSNMTWLNDLFSFYSSSTQSAGELAASVTLGQRIR